MNLCYLRSPASAENQYLGDREISSCDDNGGAGEAVLEVLHALDLVAAAAGGAALEQRRAQPHRRHPVPVLPQIPEPTRATDGVSGVGGEVGGLGVAPFGEGGGAVGGGVLVAGGEGREEEEDEEEERGSHGSRQQLFVRAPQ